MLARRFARMPAETFNLGAVGSNPTGLTNELNKLTDPDALQVSLLGNILGNNGAATLCVRPVAA
jgi:hypothetical protein